MSHVADVLLEPLFTALALIVLSYALSKRSPRVAFALPGVAFAILVFFSIPRVSNSLERSLEEPPLTTMKSDVTYDAVIVLGGAMNGIITSQTGAPAWNESAERVLTAYDLLRTGRAKSAILSGGLWPGTPPGVQPEARLMATALAGWGIDPSRLALEERSANTHENAVEATRIARARGWTQNLLVTSAAHMERARGCFARQGLPVDTLAVDFGSYDPAITEIGWLPRAGALSQSTSALRERAGRIVYRLRGWSE